MVERLEIEPRGAARGTVIWLHGLGADGHDFEPLVRQWGLADELSVRFILPHAPVRPVTINAGARMRAWYDIYDVDFVNREDQAGIEQARGQLLALMEGEKQRGIDSARILLAGFSQGGAVVLHTGLRFAPPLAGVLALSCYLPLRQQLAAQKQADPKGLVVRMDHGLYDSVVPFRAAQESLDCMRTEGFEVDFHSYAMDHSLCPEQADSLRDWLAERLA